MELHFLIIVSFLHFGQSMPQNRNRNRPGTRENPVGGFRPIVNENNNRNNAGKAKSSIYCKSNRRPRYIWTDRLKVGCPTVGLLKTKKILFLKTAGFLSKMEIFL